MRRREFITLIGGAAAWPLAARAQQNDRVRRISVLMIEGQDDPDSKARIESFRQALQRLGWTEGGNLEIACSRSSGRFVRASTRRHRCQRSRARRAASSSDPHYPDCIRASG